MAASFFFYDLETSGINPRSARIMQFAGQRTDMDLQPIGEPVNLLIKLTRDVLPEPDAILITGITPQATLENGITEAAFLKLFSESIAVPDTTFAGFNSVRFDDEFMRYLHYRNLDRKSTRLNSSHPSISYAVFCLKKKNCCRVTTIIIETC